VVLAEFIESDTVSGWKQPMAVEVMASLVFGTSRHFFAGVGIFQLLKARREIGRNVAVQSLRAVFARALEHDNLTEYPNARRYCGGIFAHLVECGLVQLTLFGGASAIPFEPGFFAGFLENAYDLDLVHLIRTSPWMQQLRFRPDPFSHLGLTELVARANMTECWPSYDAMARVVAAMEARAGLAEFAQTVGGCAPYDDNFVEFAAEVLVIFKPIQYVQVLVPVAKRALEVAVLHIERVAEFHRWDVKRTAHEIGGLAGLLDYDLKAWKRAPGRRVHEQIARVLAVL
jgi:hypothetical protein